MNFFHFDNLFYRTPIIKFFVLTKKRILKFEDSFFVFNWRCPYYFFTSGIYLSPTTRRSPERSISKRLGMRM